MKINPQWILLASLMAFVGLPGLTPAADLASCECPKLDCGQCAEEQGLTFYSEKCGADGAQVKSCARPTCVPLENPPTSCKSVPKQADVSKSSEPAKKAVQERGAEVATVKTLVGSAWVKLPDGTRNPAAVGTVIRERDTLETEPTSKLEVEFKDGNVVHVQSESKVRVNEYELAAEKRKAVLDLLKGQIRNQVKQKYNGETSSYQIRTKTAVAGVRGTDFVASYNEGDKVETEIKTIEGKVVLASKDFSDSLEVSAGQQAAYVVASNSVFGDDDINEFVARGYMTPVYKMSEAEVKKLAAATMVSKASAREVAALKKICNEPKGELNQCQWKCENNPKGEKTCRTDLQQVSCIRKRCNANGLWAEETRLPAALSEQCQAKDTKVAPCDY